MSRIDFSRAHYLLSATAPAHYPEDSGAEIAIAGRSNAGKSSSINAITNQRALARTSRTPGRTQALNFFGLEEELRLVDLPGFGFAKVPAAMRVAWSRQIDRYFRERESLRGLVLVMDIRHPPKDFELALLDWCGEANLPAHLLLNKADKLSRNESAKQLGKLRKDVQSRCACSVQAFSALKKTGIDEARNRLEVLLLGEEADPA